MRGLVGSDAFHLIAQGHQVHRFRGFRDPTENAPGLIIDKNGIAVRHEVRLGLRHQNTPLLPQLSAKQAENLTNLLKREAFSSERSNHENLDNLVRNVNASVILDARGNQLTLIPPLELAQADSRDATHIRAQEYPLA
jgi:hypothetical protein